MNTEKEARRLCKVMRWLTNDQGWRYGLYRDGQFAGSWLVEKEAGSPFADADVELRNRYNVWQYLGTTLFPAVIAGGDVLNSSRRMKKKQAKRLAEVLNWLTHDGRWSAERYGVDIHGKVVWRAVCRESDRHGTLLDMVETVSEACAALNSYHRHEQPNEHEDPHDR